MFPILLIAIGVAVLFLGKRLSVLGAAVGALLGVGLLSLLPGMFGPLLQLVIPLGLAVAGFFAAGFAKGIINIVVLVIGVLAGAAIVLGFFDLFGIDSFLVKSLLALVGGVAGLVLVRRYKDWAIIILAGLVGGLLVTCGLAAWLPVLQGAAGSLLVIVLAGVSIASQGGLFSKRKPAAA